MLLLLGFVVQDQVNDLSGGMPMVPLMVLDELRADSEAQIRQLKEQVAVGRLQFASVGERCLPKQFVFFFSLSFDAILLSLFWPLFLFSACV